MNDKQSIDNLTKTFFDIFTNTKKKQPDWNIIHTICLPETIVIKKDNQAEEVYNPDTFITPRRKILSDGTPTEFDFNYN